MSLAQYSAVHGTVAVKLSEKTRGEILIPIGLNSLRVPVVLRVSGVVGVPGALGLYQGTRGNWGPCGTNGTGYRDGVRFLHHAK